MKKKPTERVSAHPDRPFEKRIQPQNALLLQFRPRKERLEIKEGWSPIDIKFPEPFPIDTSDPDRFKVGFWFDLRLRLPLIVKALKEIYHHGNKRMIIESRKGRYAKEEIDKVRELQQQGLNDTEIFRVLHPEHKNFKFKRDYVIGGKKKAIPKFSKIRRLSRKAKELKP